MKQTTDFNFGLRVKQLLEMRGISTTQFFKAIDLPCQRYYDWCNKGAIPNVLMAMKVAKFFNMTVEQLINGTDSDPLTEVVENLQNKLEQIRKICG